jgi:glutamine amidotransferase
MCRLFGLRANRPVDVGFSLVSGPTPFRQFGEKHRSGWGIGSYHDNLPQVCKEPLPGHDSEALARSATVVSSTIILAHVRSATSGGPKRENCHPFSSGKWLFAHNGGLDRPSLLERLEDSRRAVLQGETDSEVFFHWILQNVEHERDVVPGLRVALTAARAFTGLNFLLSDGSTLFAYREASKNLNYYSLFFLCRNPLDQLFERFESSEVGALLQSKTLRGEKTVLVCSEKLTGEDWRPIEPGHLLIVPETLAPEMVKVR